MENQKNSTPSNVDLALALYADLLLVKEKFSEEELAEYEKLSEVIQGLREDTKKIIRELSL